MKTTCEIRTYPESAGVTPKRITIKNHGSDHGKVILVIDEQEYPVMAHEVIKATQNCTR